MDNIPKMQTIKELAALMKESGNTHITESTIRRFISDGLLPCVRAGKKTLISLEVFQRFLNGETVGAAIPEPTTKVIPIKAIKESYAERS